MAKRRVKRSEHRCKDRVSSLPDEILVFILSFLELKEAARTSILSKRWINLWTNVLDLNFDATQVLQKLSSMDLYEEHNKLRQEGRHKYVRCVNKVLKLHKPMTLNEFRVAFDLDKSYQKQINNWLEYAFSRKVQNLVLDLTEYSEFLSPSCQNYAFPLRLLGLNARKTVGKKTHQLINFKSLKRLSLKRVNVCDEVLQFFLNNCPFLESLVVVRSGDLIRFQVSGQSLALKHLEITYCYRLESIFVSDINLVSLKVTRAERLVLQNVPMLVDVSLSGCSHNILKDAISWLSCCFSKLEVLTLLHLNFQVIKENSKHFELPELTKVKQLTLAGQASRDDSLIGSTSLVRASPNLEKFVLKLNWHYDIVRIRREFEEAISYPLQHLKEVELCGYYGRTSELELVHYFLQNALNLEKIVIDPRNQLAFRCTTWNAKIKLEQIAKSHAQKQLEGSIPSHVELVIL